MTVTPTCPGVYIEEDASRSISVSHAATAVPVFIGVFRRLDGVALSSGQCIPVNNWLDFSSTYVTLPDVSVAFTSTPPAQGGGEYTYSRVLNAGVTPLCIQSYFQNGGGPCYLLPLINPASTTELAAIPDAIAKESDITLLVSVYSSPDEQTAVYNSINSLLQNDQGYFLLADSSDGSTVPSTEATQTAVYYPKITVRASRPADTAIAVSGYRDASHPDGDEITTLDRLNTVNPAQYALVSEDIDTLLSKAPVSPAAALAGIYCANDRNRGVWKAPANVEINGIAGVTALVSDNTQGAMNNKGINVIRYFPDRGYRVWGARTLAGTLANSDLSWRYISVRRLFNSAERDIREAMQGLVFEPNNPPTWQKASNAIENYLYDLWRQGALAGATPEESYSVEIGLGSTMTQEQINQGQMIASVGIAAVRPAEFIILQFTQDMANFVASVIDKTVVSLDIDTDDIAADGSTQLKAHVTLTDANRSPLSNVAVAWSSDGNAIITSADANTNEAGISNVTLTNLKAEVVKLTATASSKTVSKFATFVAGAVANIEVIIDDDNITADGTTPLKAHATVTDANSNPVQNVAVSWSSSDSATIASADANTSASGISNVTVTDLKAEQTNLTATASGKTGSKSATFVDTTVASITISVLDPDGIANGATPIAAQALVENAQGQPVPDDTVITWSADNAIPSPVTSSTKNGVANTSYTSAIVGEDTLIATAENNVKGSSPVTFAALTFGSLTFTQPVPNGNADNTPLTLTVKLLDSCDIPIEGATINWETVAGKAIAADDTSTTDQDGFATMDYSSGNVGMNTVSAEYDGHPMTQEVVFI